jgi:hypothetical protein
MVRRIVLTMDIKQITMDGMKVQTRNAVATTGSGKIAPVRMMKVKKVMESRIQLQIKNRRNRVPRGSSLTGTMN